jgi:hypothetical protein
LADHADQSWPQGISAITLFVEDLEGAKEFHGRAFDLPVVFEDSTSAVYRFVDTVINLLKSTAADELIAPASVGTPGAGARMQLTLEVDGSTQSSACRGLLRSF